MKKLVSLLLALVLVFAFAATATAATWNDVEIPDYSDVEGLTEEQQVAIYTLTALGITEGMNGWGGAYAGDTNFTREQLAKIAVYLVGEEDAADLYASFASQFSDVQEGRWSEGYINLAYELGLMKGVSTTSMVFAPTSTVSYQEYVTVVLRALGYDDNLPGNWPADYSNKAVKMGLTKYTDYVGPKAIDRADMAVITSNALDEYLVTYVGRDSISGLIAAIDDEDVDKDGYMYESWFTNEDWELDQPGTLLSEIFDCLAAPVEVVFGAVYEELKESAGWALEDGELKIELAYGFDAEVASDYYIYGADVIDLAGQYGDALLQWNEDEEEYEILFVEILSNIAYGEFVADDYDFAKDFECEDVANAAIYTNEDDEVYFVYDYAEFVDKSWGIVDGIDEEVVEMKVLPEDYDYEGDFTFFDEDEELEFVLAYDMVNGGFMAVEDLEEGDVVYYAGLVGEEEDIDLELILVYPAQTGEWEKASSNYIKVDGEKLNTIDCDDCGMWSLYSWNDMAGFDFYDYHAIADFDGAVTYGLSYIPGAFTYISDDVFATVQGVIVDFEYDYDHRDNVLEYSSITLFQADGKEYTYEIDFSLDDFNKGDYVELKLEDGESVDDIKGLAYIANCAPESVVITVKDAEDSLIKINGALEEVADDAVIYVISLDGAAFDEVELISAEELLEGDDYIADQIYVDGDTYVIYELWDGLQGIAAEGMDLMGLPGIDALVEVRDGGYVLEVFDGEDMDGKSLEIAESLIVEEYADLVAKLSNPGVIVYDLLKGEVTDFHYIINGESMVLFLLGVYADYEEDVRNWDAVDAVLNFDVDGEDYEAYIGLFDEFVGASKKYFEIEAITGFEKSWEGWGHDVEIGTIVETIEFVKGDATFVDLTGDEAEIIEASDIEADDVVVIIADGDDAVYVLLVAEATAEEVDINNVWNDWMELSL